MHHARINGSEKPVLAKKYTPKKGDVITCADSECHAELLFIPEHCEQGGITRAAHFASKRRGDHRAQCSELQREDKLRNQSVTVEAAIAHNWPIMMNLNDRQHEWGLPQGMIPHFGTRKDIERMNTPLYAFQQANRNADTNAREFAPFSVKSVRDVARLLTTIEHSGEVTMLQKTYATWQQSVIPFEHFFTDTDTSLTDLFWHLNRRSYDKSHRFSSRWQGQDYACGFPRLFKFIPAQKTREEPLSFANSTSIEMQHPQTGKAMILINRLDFTRATETIDRDKLLRTNCMVLAVPRVSSTLLESATKRFNDNKTGVIWAFIDWMIVGRHQIMPAKEFKPKLRPDRGPQMRLL